MEYSDGVRPYILEWYYVVFLKAFEEKEKPDSKINSKGDELIEDRIALTSQDIIKKHKEIHKEILTSKQLLDSYLYPLLNQGYIDKTDSVIDRRAKIYYPIITTKKYINLFENDKSNNFSPHKEKIVVNSTVFPSKQYIISKIEPIVKYYSENKYFIKIKNHLDGEISLEQLVDQYFKNPNYFIEEQSSNITETTSTDEKISLIKGFQNNIFKV
jgi:hypothetical protein